MVANEEGNYTATTESPNDIPQNYIHASNLWICVSPVLLVGGTAGNLLSGVVMLRPGLRELTTSVYLLVLALVDTLILYTGLLPKWILWLSENRTDIRNNSNATCRALVFVVYTCTQLQAWILVCVAVERASAIFFPHKAKQIFTRKFAAAQMAIIEVVLAIINCHFWWKFKLVKRRCTKLYDSHGWEIFSWFDLALASLLPFLIILVSNTAIGIKLIRANRARRARLNHGTDAKLTSMTAILFSISLVFLLTTAPIAWFINVNLKFYTGTTDSFSQMTLADAVVNLLFYTNFSHNFFLYCVSSPRFRREFVSMFPRQAADSGIMVELDERVNARERIEG